MKKRWVHTAAIFAIFAPLSAFSQPRNQPGKADLQGIWQIHSTATFDLQDHNASLGLPAGRSVIVEPSDGKIPYRPAAMDQKTKNFENRASNDPLGKCFMPGVPRINYLDFPFQIFQTPQYVVIVYEFAHIYRTIYLNGQHPEGLDFWMGDSRGHWEGDALVVDVADFNDQTWFDMAGDYHSDALHVVERYTRTGTNTLRYEATIEDPKVFTKPWKISMTADRHTELNARLLEYECNAYAESAAKSAGK